ncbi:MAG TPA: TonB-dependent receptor, partial [Longimicrobiales bacterium]
MKVLNFLFAVALAGVAAPLSAQGPSVRPAPPLPPTGEVRGTVVDAESNTPIASAAVAVWNQADAKLVTGVLVREDGSFRIEGLRPGTYYLRLSMIGYAPHNTAPFTVSEAAPRTALGSIKLTRSAVEVAGVVASAERQMTIAPDRNSYRVKDVAPAAGNASDVLENVPSVSVDADGKVSLRGNENVVIQINGRPTPITGGQLAGYLRQLPANTIERVEVVPNPSAKQDPEGMAGIINIVMKQGVDLGTSGGFTLLGSTADRYSASGNIGHQSGPLAVFLTYGFNSDQRKFTGLNDRTRLDPDGTPYFYTEQDLGGTNQNNGHNVSANADYQLSKSDVLSTTLNFNRRGASEDSRSLYNEYNDTRTSVSTYDRLRNVDSNNWMADALLSFKHTFAPQKHDIAAEVRFNRQHDGDNTDLWREAFVNATRTDLENDVTSAGTHQLTGQVDYTRPLGKQYKLET